MGLRRLYALTTGLPPASALARAVWPEGADWDIRTELLAALVELVDAGNRLFYSANTKRGTRAPDPVTIPRPELPEGMERPRKPPRIATPDELRRFADQF